MTDADLLAQLATDQVLAITLYGEARGEAVEGRIAVASVVMNRVKAKRFGHDARAVCLAPLQFSCWQPKGGQENYDDVMAIARATANGTAPGPILRECAWIALGALSGDIRDRVNGSTHYLTADLFRIAPPAWAKGKTPAVRVGSQLFFAGIA